MVAQAVHQQVEQAAGLIALGRLAGRERPAAQAREHVAGLDVRSERSGRGPASPLLEGIGGYFEDAAEAELNQPGTRRSVAAYALGPANAARLWQVSVQTLG